MSKIASFRREIGLLTVTGQRHLECRHVAMCKRPMPHRWPENSQRMLALTDQQLAMGTEAVPAPVPTPVLPRRKSSKSELTR